MRNRHTFCIGDFYVKLNEVEMVYPPFWVKNYISFSKGIKGGIWNRGVLLTGDTPQPRGKKGDGGRPLYRVIGVITQLSL